jgi:hypothetical protein
MSWNAEVWLRRAALLAGLVGVGATLGACGDTTRRDDEVCNHLDDDGNGIVDDPFVDVEGAYLRVENCGHCGVDCSGVFPTAAEVACAPLPQGPTCVLVACPPGSHAADGAVCVADDDTLCSPCRTDADCTRPAPGARCIAFGPGDARCGRACDPEAVESGCPAGFACAPWQGTAQCMPASGACGCLPDTAGTSFGCWMPSPSGERYCHGAQQCDGKALSACVVTALETCDGEDDDCDDLVDETFLVDGQYQSAEHCGACDTPCATGSAHMVATCVADGAVPACRIECEPGFADLDGARLNGCECELVAAAWPPGAHGVDGDCDGRVDASEAYIYVAKRGDDANPGTLDRPVRTIERGLTLGEARGQPVFVAQGRYDEVVELRDGVSLFGGYRSDFGARDTVVFASIVEHLSGVPGTPVFRAEGIRSPTDVAGFTLVGSPGPAPGGGSTTAVVAESGPALVLRELVVLAGPGADGEEGASSSAVAAERGIASLDILDGVPGTSGDGGVEAAGAVCRGLAAEGGRPGLKQCPDGQAVDGGAGAGADCPDTGCRPDVQCGNSGCTDFTVDGICDTAAMQRAAVANDAGADGTGPGAGRGGEPTYDSPTPYAFDCFCEDNPTLRREGAPGESGAAGQDGSGGLGFSDAVGEFDAETGLWRGGDGTDGADGTHGGGAGGGSHGAGYDVLESNGGPCVDHLGGAGGGGGSGGCGAPLARGGRGGGASIGLLLRLPAGGQGPDVRDVTVFPAAAGRGGAGGLGAAGGRAGLGGLGGLGNFWCARAGGKGGDGGGGGHAGGGGGGGGGSISGFHVVPDPAFPGDARAYVDALAVLNEVGALPAPGRGGAGGFSPGRPGTPGAAGTAEAFRLLVAQ